MTKKRKNDQSTSLKKELDTALRTEVKSKLNKCLGVFVNAKYKTCIAIERRAEGYLIVHVTMNKGVVLERIPVPHFEGEWRFSDTSSVSRAAQVYAEYSQYLGGTDEALAVLQQFTTLTQQEVLMAKKKADERANPVVPASSAKGKALAKAAVARAEKGKGQKKETSKAMFDQLIMDGKLTDDQIFAKVQEKFGLPKKARGYVSWYRRKLKQDGKNPPPAKENKGGKTTAKSTSTKPKSDTHKSAKPKSTKPKSAKPKNTKSAADAHAPTPEPTIGELLGQSQKEATTT